jgi:hypothetical protein
MSTRFRWTALLAAVVCFVTSPSHASAAAQAATPTAATPPAATPTAGPDPSPAAMAYLDAVRKGDVAGVERAIAGGVAVDTPFRYKRTALSFAADRGQVEIVRLLLAKGANPDTPDSFYNQTPLGWAAQPAQTRKPEHVAVVKLLLEKGAKGKERALGAAIGAGDVGMVQVILDSGGLPTALLSESLAAVKKGGKAEIAAALEKAGATMPVVVTLTPAQLARYAGTYNDGRETITLAVKDGAIVATGGGPPLTLSPRSETSFAVESRPGTVVTFELEGERATSVTVNQGGTPSVYKRATP